MFETYPEMMSVEEMAEALNMGRTNAYRLIQENKIHFLRNGRTYKIPRIALEEYVLRCSGLKV